MNAFDRATRFLQIVGTLNARIGSDERQLLDELIRLWEGPKASGDADAFRHRIADLIVEFRHLPSMEIIAELVSVSVNVAKILRMPPMVFFHSAMMAWGGEVALGAKLWTELLEKAKAQAPPPKPADPVN